MSPAGTADKDSLSSRIRHSHSLPVSARHNCFVMAPPSTQQQQQLPSRPARLSSSKPAFALPSSSGSSQASPSPTTIPPTSSYSKNNNPIIDSSDDETDSDDDDAPLPFPAALARSDFLAPDFDPVSYLSSLVAANRHQTLEDLRGDLRDRSAAISTELLELVNANYTAFLSLGSELKGGEERVEDVRVSLLGFRRAVEEIKSRVKERGGEVGRLNGELLDVRRHIETGRMMVELDERVAEVESRLALGSDPARDGHSSDDEEDDDTEEDEDEETDEDIDGNDASARRTTRPGSTSRTHSTASPAKLGHLARAYVAVEDLAEELGRDTPFVRKMDERLMRCRNTILLDLNTALKETKRAMKESSKGSLGDTASAAAKRKKGAAAARILRLMDIYAILDAQSEAVKTLKSA